MHRLELELIPEWRDVDPAPLRNLAYWRECYSYDEPSCPKDGLLILWFESLDMQDRKSYRCYFVYRDGKDGTGKPAHRFGRVVKPEVVTSRGTPGVWSPPPKMNLHHWARRRQAAIVLRQHLRIRMRQCLVSINLLAARLESRLFSQKHSPLSIGGLVSGSRVMARVVRYLHRVRGWLPTRHAK